MWVLNAIFLTIILIIPTVQTTTSTKRGLVYIPNKKHPSDDGIWAKQGSDLTWYYNYLSNPTASLSIATFQFVPMLWGVPAANAAGGFYTTVKSLKDDGHNISYALGFNEPDGSSSTGGSNIPAKTAASTWIAEMEPLRELGIQLGAPAVTGSSSGLSWLQDFFTYCRGQCHIDFIPIHWYGDFQGLASFIGQVRQKYANISTDIWLTEYALPKSSLQDSQAFYNQSADYLDRLE
jgi:hypothetical protein